jgi:hypothetical protein
MRFLDEYTEDWMEREVGAVMDRFEQAGTPIRGGAAIVELMREAYCRGYNAGYKKSNARTNCGYSASS